MISLRQRIVLTLLPLFVLMAIVGGYGATLIYRIGGRIDEILRENYNSVLYMERVKEALERIDSGFQFALAGREESARAQVDENWQMFVEQLEKERANITLPGEELLVARLTKLGDEYHQRGAAFFASSDMNQRSADYFGAENQPGLLAMFKDLKEVANRITRINQDNMEQANREAQQTARASLLWFAVCLGVVAIIALLLARRTIDTILRPVRNLTESVLAIGAGNLDQLVSSSATDELGQLAGAVNTMARQLRDYRQSQKARLLRIQQAAQATVNSFPDPVVVVDQEGLVELANPAAERILSLSTADADATRARPWQPPAALRGALEGALRHEQAFLPEGFDAAILIRGGGDPQYFLPRILPIRDPYGGTLGAAVLLADVTRFQLLDQVKSDLVATVSHELKTPLASVSLAIHLLLEEVIGPLTPKQTELLLEARTGSERLLAMINNLLDLARLEKGAGHLEVRPEQPRALLQAAADLVRQRADDQGVEIVVRAPADLPAVAVDSRVLNHALRNLLENALTYCDTQGRITLDARQTADAVEFTVADTGIGIPPEYAAHIFERFFRVPGQSRGTGTGLGLAIVREIVVAHGGHIECTSTPGQGTTFRLALPVWRGEDASDAERVVADATAPQLPTPSISAGDGRHT
jgi:signal transduction histidine kinase/HAMP domain-containing protein